MPEIGSNKQISWKAGVFQCIRYTRLAPMISLLLMVCRWHFQNMGPVVLLHNCQNFPYGSQWGDSTSMTGANTVVITGIDTDINVLNFNNRWGDKVQAAGFDFLLKKLTTTLTWEKTLGFWPAEA